MIHSFDEGDAIDLPCRHCLSLSLKLAVRTGVHALSCERCGRRTRVEVRRADDGWTIAAEAADDGVEAARG
ncbi:MAG: hypothetical protein HYY17_13490 [Planctomycetes bacterium]|nr:hypothetical protein [Planctomycetota bacterium]